MHGWRRRFKVLEDKITGQLGSFLRPPGDGKNRNRDNGCSWTYCRHLCTLGRGSLRVRPSERQVFRSVHGCGKLGAESRSNLGALGYGRWAVRAPFSMGRPDSVGPHECVSLRGEQAAWSTRSGDIAMLFAGLSPVVPSMRSAIT